MKEKAHAVDMRIAVEVVDTRSVERARPTDYAVDLVSLGEEQFGEIGAVLAGDASDEGFFHNFRVLLTS